ncbi:MAG: nucleotidyltransferase domain-containing protein [Methanobacteriota archaeon]
MVNSLVSSHRDEIISIARRHGAHNIRIFGSYVRGEERHGSDLNLLGDIDPDKSLLDQVALIQDLEAVLNIHVDVVESQYLHWFIKEKVLFEAVPL